MPVANESLVLDGIPLNDETLWRILDGSFQFTPARKKLNWVSTPLADGSALVGDEDHYENAEMTFKLRMEQQVDTDTALSVLNDLTTKLQTARNIRGGLPLVWTPSGSGNSLTLYVLDAEYDEMPMAYEEGWVSQQPSLVVHLYLRPFLYGAEQQLTLGLSDPFVYDSLTNGGWRIETGAGTMAISNGLLTVSSTAAKRIYRPATVTDSTITTRFRTGTSSTGTVTNLHKHLATGTAGNLDSITVFYNGATPVITIQKKVNAVGTALASSSSFTSATSTWYWLQSSIIGNDITGAIYADAQDPLNNPNATPLATVVYTLTGGDATQFGDGVRGNPGLQLGPSDNSWQVDQWTLRDAPDIQNTEPLFGFEVTDIGGHVEAEGRLVVLEGSSQNRAHFEWGLESRNYDPTVVWPLIIDSDTMTTSSFAGTQGSYAGAYDPNPDANNSVTATNISETVPLTVCSTGAQLHVGAFKVKGRMFGTEGVTPRLNWRIGDGQATRNDFAPALTGVDWQELDLGTVIIPEAGIGNQSWTGRIEASGVSAGSVFIDYLEMIPLERYGVARAPLRPITPSVYTAFDNFNQTAGTLNGKTLGSGQTWASTTAGTVDYSIDATLHLAKRTAISDAGLDTGRFALVGSAVYSGIQVQVDVGVLEKDLPVATGALRAGLLLRYVDASNFVIVVREPVTTAPATSAKGARLRIYKRVAGTTTALATITEGNEMDLVKTVIASIDAAGVYQVYLFQAGTKQPTEPRIVGQDSVLATGGALDDGKIGLYDAYTDTDPATRIYNNFVAFASDTPVVFYSGRHLEIRADRTEREASGGTSYGRVPVYRGERFLLPTSNGASAVARVAVKARRSDVDGGLPDNQIADSITVAAYATPRFLVPSVSA